MSMSSELDLDTRRRNAQLTLIAALDHIANKYRLCDVCLLSATVKALNVMYANGERKHNESLHAGDEFNKPN